MKKETILLTTAATSTIMLIAFGILKENDAAFLKLEAQWIFVASFPMVLGLFIAGYITRFKGFGVELESQLNKTSIASIDLTARDAVADIPGDEKRSMGYLNDLSRDRIDSTQWLRFESGRSGYTSRGVYEYIERLTNLQFLEILRPDGSFVAFIPIDAVKTVEHGDVVPDRRALEKFVGALEDDNVPAEFRREVITTQVGNNEGLISVLTKLRKQRVELGAVEGEGGEYLGAIRSSDIEKRIADSVLIASSA
ncbi:MAG: hypothetical protein AAGA96_16330 [Verrucomicrobiota bacterium]